MLGWFQTNWRALTVSIVVSLVLGMPIHVYMHYFGDTISADHERWSQMGSAMSGIYGPILSILTFVVLVFQFGLQRMTLRREYQQSYLQRSRDDINFYLTQLTNILSKTTSAGLTVGQLLKSKFACTSQVELYGVEIKELAQSIDLEFPELQATLAAIYSIYRGLASKESEQHTLEFISAQQKSMAMFSYATCVCLEHFLFISSGRRLPYPYQFSPILNPHIINGQ